MSLRDLSLVAAGGAVGSMARYLASSAVMRAVSASFPWGTWMVNAAGCLAIGLIGGYGVRHAEHFPNEVRLLCITGFLGGFTTFSAFGLETWTLISRSDYGAALFNVVSQCAVGIAAVATGFWLTR